MKDSFVVGGGLGLAILLAGVASVLTDSPAVLGVTAVGFAIYLVVGIGLPQYVLSRRSGSRLQLGLAALAVGAAAVIVIAAVSTSSLHEESTVGLSVLALVVLGNVLGAGVRELQAGYRSAS